MTLSVNFHFIIDSKGKSYKINFYAIKGQIKLTFGRIFAGKNDENCYLIGNNLFLGKNKLYEVRCCSLETLN